MGLRPGNIRHGLQLIFLLMLVMSFSVRAEEKTADPSSQDEIEENPLGEADEDCPPLPERIGDARKQHPAAPAKAQEDEQNQEGEEDPNVLSEEEASRFAAAFKEAQPPYTVGEELIYTLKWSGISAGKAVLKVSARTRYEGHDVYTLYSHTESNAFVSAFYDVNNKSYSYVDAKEGFTRYFKIEKHERRHVYVDTVGFDYDSCQAYFNRFEDGKDKPEVVPTFGHVSDPTSVLFYYRQFDNIDIGDEIPIPLNVGRKNHLVSMKAASKELVKVRHVGIVKAIQMVPGKVFLDGPAFTKGKSNLWIEAETKIPIRITVELSFGAVTMYLVNAKNVKGFEALTRKQIRQARKDGYK